MKCCAVVDTNVLVTALLSKRDDSATVRVIRLLAGINTKTIINSCDIASTMEHGVSYGIILTGIAETGLVIRECRSAL